jgi:tRNA-Thr(GGU) m(6)t(6)A37 methyltransferase TsaA
MSIEAPIRPGEIEVPLPAAADAGICFIGRLRTPWPDRDACPKLGDPVSGPPCRIEVFELWRPALAGIEGHAFLQVLYWMHLARRDLVLQRPRSAERGYGTFALRSPVRPNPIAVASVALLAVDGGTLTVRGLDCVDGTPLVDLKPDRCPAHP